MVAAYEVSGGVVVAGPGNLEPASACLADCKAARILTG